MDTRFDEAVHLLWLQLASRGAGSRLILNRLERHNQTASTPVTAPGGPVVSLTTYGKRIDTVYLTLESIARGSLLPSRLILWMNEVDSYEQRPGSLRRLEARGLEIMLTENFGPHKKYYPYIALSGVLDTPLATADDDTIYPVNWLKRLKESYDADPAVVSCYRAHVVRFDGKKLAPYKCWPWCRSTTPSFLNFSTGVSGTIYPPELLRQLKASGDGFKDICPRADDVWLHVHALRGGFKIKQLKPWAQSFLALPGTQEMALFLDNVHGAQNDLQIQKTYTEADIELLRMEPR
jgi:hypothetical protein